MNTPVNALVLSLADNDATLDMPAWRAEGTPSNRGRISAARRA